MSGCVKLLHFDIKTFGNYGDTLLFEAVRQTFHAFGDRQLFDLHDSRPLRSLVEPDLVDLINEEYDGIVVGGGGLFLADTNANSNSGWQWNMPLPQLDRLEKPIILFAVGNNRFVGQPDFGPLFREHVSHTLERSVFFGLRNTGSVATIRDHVPAEMRDRISYQPCPTTFCAELFPDLVESQEVSDERRLGVQLSIGRRHVRAGIDPAPVYDSTARVLRRLVDNGWSIDGIAHHRADRFFLQHLERLGVPFHPVRLHDSDDALYRGVEYYARLPIAITGRGHGQMIPFGVGSIPVAILVHDKLRYFLDDIGHPELGIDPWADGFEQRLYDTVTGTHQSADALLAELSAARARLFEVTLTNLVAIYRAPTGVNVNPSFRPYTSLERRLAEQALVVGARDRTKTSPSPTSAA